MPRKAKEEAAPSLGAAILATASGTDDATQAALNAELDAAGDNGLDPSLEPPIEDLPPVVVDKTDYAALEAQRKVHPAARERFTNVPTVDEAAPSVTLTMVTVTIDRDLATKMEKVVFEHELPALQAVFGFDLVNIKEDSAVNVKVDHFSPVEELMRLQQRYDRRNLDVITKAYPRGARDIAELAGVQPEVMRSTQQKLSQQKIRPREGQVLRNRT
jgi:hypothetical protein